MNWSITVLSLCPGRGVNTSAICMRLHFGKLMNVEASMNCRRPGHRPIIGSWCKSHILKNYNPCPVLRATLARSTGQLSSRKWCHCPATRANQGQNDVFCAPPHGLLYRSSHRHYVWWCACYLTLQVFVHRDRPQGGERGVMNTHFPFFTAHLIQRPTMVAHEFRSLCICCAA